MKFDFLGSSFPSTWPTRCVLYLAGQSCAFLLLFGLSTKLRGGINFFIFFLLSSSIVLIQLSLSLSLSLPPLSLSLSPLSLQSHARLSIFTILLKAYCKKDGQPLAKGERENKFVFAVITFHTEGGYDIRMLNVCSVHLGGLFSSGH